MRFCRQKHFKRLAISPSPFPYSIRVSHGSYACFFNKRIKIGQNRLIDEKVQMVELGSYIY